MLRVQYYLNVDRDQLDGNNSIKRLMSSADMLPGIIMSILMLGMLISDLLVPDMDSLQYIVFPVAFRICSIISVACGIICVAKSMMSNYVRLNAGWVMLGLFAVWMIVSTLVNGVSPESVSGVPYRYLGTADYIICLFAFMGCSSLIRTEKTRHMILQLYVITADLIAVTALYDRFIGAIPAYGNKIGLSAIFFHENHYGYFLVMATLISAGYFIYGTGRQFYAGTVSAILNLVVLGINRSFGCILAVGCVIIILLLIVSVSDRPRRRRVLYLTLFLVAATAVAAIVSKEFRFDLYLLVYDIHSLPTGGYGGRAGHGRWKLWAETLGYIRERPLFGYGCEGIEDMLMDATGVSSAHNEVLTYAAFFGIPAAVLYLCGIVASLISSYRHSGDQYACRIAFMAASGYLISSMFGVAMFYTLPFLFIFAGFSLGNAAE